MKMKNLKIYSEIKYPKLFVIVMMRKIRKKLRKIRKKLSKLRKIKRKIRKLRKIKRKTRMKRMIKWKKMLLMTFN